MNARGERVTNRLRPGALACGIALLTGALAVQALPILPPRWFDGVLLVGALCVFAFVAMRRGHATFVLLVIVIAAFGWTAWRADLAMDARLPRALEGRDFLVTGSIDDLPQVQAESTRFEFDVSSAQLGGETLPLKGTLRLAWYAAHGAQPPTLTPCARWRLMARLKRPRALLNPGGVDFERTALQQRIVATGYVRDDPSDAQLARPFCIDALRARIASAITVALPDDPHAARLLRALSVGDQRALDENDWQIARATGISHLIAISGFHVGLAAIFGALLARALWWLFPALALRLPRPLAEAWIALPAAVAYGALAGFGLPTTRTLLMIAVVSLSRIARRGGGMGEGFGLALCAILIVDPLSVLSAGFWLSFLGVAFLAWTLARGSGWRGHLREFGFAPFLMTLALLPLTVWFFGQASLVAPLANLIAVPFVSLVIVPLNLAACALLLTLPSIGVPLLHVCAHLVDAQWWLLTKMAAWPAALHYLPAPGAGAFVMACLGAIWLLAPRGVPARALAGLLFLPLCWPKIALPPQGGFASTVLDVGQGLSVLVRTRQHALLFDTGAKYPSGFDLGEAVVTPSLHALGVDHLDMLIVSHGDNDHAGGAPAVLAAFPGTPAFGGEPDRGNVPLRQCAAGQQWNWDGVAFRILHPSLPITLRGNDVGCVLLVSGRGGQLLLPADTSAHVEPEIAQAVGTGAPLVLIAPHHGSKTASSENYLRALHPLFAIASNGYLNRFHHPAPVIVARYRALGVPLLNTPVTGAVSLTFPIAGTPRVTAEERIRQAHYWREH